MSYHRVLPLEKLLYECGVRFSEAQMQMILEVKREFQCTNSEAIRLLIEWGWEYYTRVKP